MFESWTEQPRENRRIAQPVLSFALHATLILFAIGRAAEPRQNEGTHEPVPRGVIYIPDAPGQTSKVESEAETPSPAPTCECAVPVPGPILVHDPGGPLASPGLRESDLWTLPEPSILRAGGEETVGLYRESDLSDSPAVQHFPDPVYPPALRAARFEGLVLVTYVVAAKGTVEPESITVVSSDHPSMTASVRAALLQARFHPGKVRGIPVRSLVRQTIRFSLMSL